MRRVVRDDDSTVLPVGVDALLEHYRQHPGHDIVTGRAVDPSGRPRKRYPRRTVRLHRWNAAKVGTIELSVRRAEVKRSGVRFDTSFGAGTDHFLGDEYVFITDGLEAGLHGVFVPIDLACHETISSGSPSPTVHDARARSAVFSRVFGPRAPLARTMFLLRRPWCFGSFGTAMRFLSARFPPDDADGAQR